MDNPRYAEVDNDEQLRSYYILKNTVLLVIVGKQQLDKVILKAKEQAQDIPTRMVIVITKPTSISPQIISYLTDGNSNIVTCTVGLNRGVASRLIQKDAEKGSKLGDAFAQAETYAGNGYCLKHGVLTDGPCKVDGCNG